MDGVGYSITKQLIYYLFQETFLNVESVPLMHVIWVFPHHVEGVVAATCIGDSKAEVARGRRKSNLSREVYLVHGTIYFKTTHWDKAFLTSVA